MRDQVTGPQRQVANDLQSLVEKFYDLPSNPIFVKRETPIPLMEPPFGFKEVWGTLESMLTTYVTIGEKVKEFELSRAE